MIVVRWIRAFVGFWIGFVVGDDWTVAATVLVALLAAWGLVSAGIPAWWLLPVAALGSTAVSLRRAARRAGDRAR
jgi:hypothetical protein